MDDNLDAAYWNILPDVHPSLKPLEFGKMDAKEAINAAKNWIRETHEEEGVRNLGLEEVRRENNLWKITVGFSRPWDENRNLSVVLGGTPIVNRTYKVVTVRDDDGEVLGSENREPSR